MARLSEKNACPTALRITLAVSFEKSGFRRKRKPSEEPGILNEQTTRMPMMKSSKGIMIFEKRSMPDCTPLAMMTWVSAMKATPASIGIHVSLTKPVKTSL